MGVVLVAFYAGIIQPIISRIQTGHNNLNFFAGGLSLHVIGIVIAACVLAL
jgi:hypothetical protein